MWNRQGHDFPASAHIHLWIGGIRFRVDGRCADASLHFLRLRIPRRRGRATEARGGLPTLRCAATGEIRGIREHHQMTRARFAEITGLGEASLNRWENGLTIQTQGNDRYIRLLALPGIMQHLEDLVEREPSCGQRRALVKTGFERWKSPKIYAGPGVFSIAVGCMTHVRNDLLLIQGRSRPHNGSGQRGRRAGQQGPPGARSGFRPGGARLDTFQVMHP